MRTLPLILTAALLASLAACNTPSTQPDVPSATGTFMASYAMAAGDGTRVRIGGITFHILQNQITWNNNGSLNLQLNWGLLELRESPAAVEISLDGVVLKTVAK
jgi:hypothetical protein